MNKYFKWSLALLVITAAGCSDDQEPKTPEITPGTSGDEVVFTFGDPKSRTTYAEPWAETGTQDIYWGNYLTNDPEQIKIYCRESHGNIATYNVNAEATGSNDAVSISKAKEDVAIRWGAQGAYEFCAFYPANQAGDAFVGESGHVIQARIVSGQSPKMYKTKGSDNKLTEESLENIAKNTATVTTNAAMIYGMPDMEAAIMMAKTDMTADEYGNPVGLEFNVLADVLDLTINGPVKPNSLGGNAKEREFIKINSVTIKAADNIALAGDFNLDMDEGKVTPLTNRTSVIQVNTADKNSQTVTLHARVDKDQAANVDKLHLRIFLMPGQVTNLNQLTVTVATDCGDYEQNLKDFEMGMVSGKINNVKLPYFNTRGTEFDFSKWIGQLDEDIYLSELSIPGTWHSSNSNYQGSATLQQQYNAGIRAFEVHTTNGTELKAYNNINEAFDITKAEFYDEHLNEVKDKTETTVTGNENDYEYGDWNNNSRTVTLKNATITMTRLSSYQQKPKFSLRLYRTRNVTDDNPNPNESFSDALIELAKIMNADGFMFFEFGMNKQRDISVNCKTVKSTSTCSWTVESLTGTQKRTGTGGEQEIEWDITVPSDAQWDNKEETNYDESMSIGGGEAWAIAVETCLNRLATTPNNKNGKTVLHTEEITANTTIKDVKGQVIAKVNTNKPELGNEGAGWSGNTPALFSRWVDGSASSTLTVNLQWGKPIAPEPLDNADNVLHWCYTEHDNVGYSTTNRENAIKEFVVKANANYVGGKHRTFYELSIGGYLGGGNDSSAEKCQNLAEKLNPYLLNVLNDPTRLPNPFGLVLMNYAIPPTGKEDTYKSADLIRTIINNNAAFTLQRRGSEATPEVEEKTNSSFNANPSSPIK